MQHTDTRIGNRNYNKPRQLIKCQMNYLHLLIKIVQQSSEGYLREAQSRIFRDMHSKYFPRGILQTVRKASEYMLIKLSHLQIFYILRNKLLITNQFNRYYELFSHIIT